MYVGEFPRAQFKLHPLIANSILIVQVFKRRIKFESFLATAMKSPRKIFTSA